MTRLPASATGLYEPLGEEGKVKYLEVPTSADLRNAVDKKTTDLNIYARTGDWYRKRLNRHFMQAGAGLWVARGSGTTLYELERSR